MHLRQIGSSESSRSYSRTTSQFDRYLCERQDGAQTLNTKQQDTQRWRERERVRGQNASFSCSRNLKPQMTARVVLNVKMDWLLMTAPDMVKCLSHLIQMSISTTNVPETVLTVDNGS